MWLGLMLRRSLLTCIFLFGSVQFMQVFITHCPDWICRNSTDAFVFQPLPNEATSRRIRGGKVKVQPGIFARYRYQDSGISLWEDDLEGTHTSRMQPVKFDINASDVLVFLHIQKTGGTAFGKTMVQGLIDASSGNKLCDCKANSKKCRCGRPTNPDREFLFSRFSTGWKCGLHADWTELTNCVDQALDQKEGSPLKRRYFYMTLLRDPYQRYLSEFLHVQRGATWRTSKHWCGGRFANDTELKPCFENDTWEGCTLNEFLGCTDNLATNRQTRMLADLSLVGCYDKTYLPKAGREKVLLTSAKKNLRKMAFLGVVEDVENTHDLFEYTFGFKFTTRLNTSYEGRGENFSVTDAQKAAIMERISLDVQLYDFAKRLFTQRVDTMRQGRRNAGIKHDVQFGVGDFEISS